MRDNYSARAISTNKISVYAESLDKYGQPTEIYDNLHSVQYVVRSRDRGSVASVIFRTQVTPMHSVVWGRGGSDLGSEETEVKPIYYANEWTERCIRVQRARLEIGELMVNMTTDVHGELEKHDPIENRVDRVRLNFGSIVSNLRVIAELTALVLPADSTAELTARAFDRESQSVKTCLTRNGNSERVNVHTEPAVQVQTVGTLILTHNPQLVHFCGHGSRAGRLVLTDSGHKPTEVPIEKLCHILKMARNLRCVVMNACYSAKQAAAIAEHVDCVVGITNTIEDAPALAFSAGFYEMLALGKSIAEAYEYGIKEARRSQFDVDTTADAGMQLVVRQGVDAASIRLLTET